MSRLPRILQTKSAQYTDDPPPYNDATPSIDRAPTYTTLANGHVTEQPARDTTPGSSKNHLFTRHEGHGDNYEDQLRSYEDALHKHAACCSHTCSTLKDNKPVTRQEVIEHGQRIETDPQYREEEKQRRHREKEERVLEHTRRMREDARYRWHMRLH